MVIDPASYDESSDFLFFLFFENIYQSDKSPFNMAFHELTLPHFFKNKIQNVIYTPIYRII